MATFTHSELEQLWLVAGGAPQWADTAAAIAEAESGGCQYAQRGPRDIRPVKECAYVIDPARYVIGLWQINWTAHRNYVRASLFGAAYNANAAVEIAGVNNDFSHWTTFTTPAANPAYRQFLQNPGSTTPQGGAASGQPGHNSLGAWHHLNLALVVDLPAGLRRSTAARMAALRKVG